MEFRIERLAHRIDALDARGLMLLALAAYASYLVNAAQFLLKLRAARLEGQRWSGSGDATRGGLGLSS